MRRAALLLLPALGLVALTGTAEAKYRQRVFVTPSKTTICMIAVDRSGKQRPWVRCDVMDATNAPPAKPKSCEFDYGFSFGVRSTGRAYRNCVSDAIADPDKTKTLPYGSSASLGGITCTAKRTGLRCVNRSGHGFRLRRDSQVLF